MCSRIFISRVGEHSKTVRCMSSYFFLLILKWSCIQCRPDYYQISFNVQMTSRNSSLVPPLPTPLWAIRLDPDPIYPLSRLLGQADSEGMACGDTCYTLQSPKIYVELNMESQELPALPLFALYMSRQQIYKLSSSFSIGCEFSGSRILRYWPSCQIRFYSTSRAGYQEVHCSVERSRYWHLIWQKRDVSRVSSIDFSYSWYPVTADYSGGAWGLRWAISDLHQVDWDCLW